MINLHVVGLLQQSLKLFIVVILSIPSIHATTMIAVSTNEEVLLGLDSKFVVKRGDDIVNTTYGCYAWQYSLRRGGMDRYRSEADQSRQPYWLR
jgi:hypothetical protein